MFVENKVPRYGMSGDKTPTVRINLKNPMPAGATLVLLRNGIEVGPVQKINDLLYQFVDTVESGLASYVAEVRAAGLTTEVSRNYEITVLSLNQAWSTGPENDQGPFIVGASGSKDWNGNYDSFYIGVVGDVPFGTTIAWETVWHAGSDGWNEPTVEVVPADGALPTRARITARQGNDNYSSGVLEITMVVNGVPMGDTLSLVLNDLPYGYETATWAVWSAPQGDLVFVVENGALDGDGSQYGTSFNVTVENTTNDVLAFNIYGISNVALEERGEAYRLTPHLAKVELLRGAAQNVELYRKNGQGEFDLVGTVDPVASPEVVAAFLLDGSIPSTDRYVRVQLRRQGSFWIAGQVEGDFWNGYHNGKWRAQANQLTAEQEVGKDYQSSNVSITTASSGNPAMEDAGGQWSWLDDAGSLMTYGSNKFVTNLSASSVFGSGNSNPVVSLDGMADSGRVRLRWTAIEGRFLRFYGDMNDVTGQPGALMNIYKLQGNQRVLVASGMKWGVSFATQLLAGEYVEFEFYATTNDRTASRFYLNLEVFNSGLNT